MLLLLLLLANAYLKPVVRQITNCCLCYVAEGRHMPKHSFCAAGNGRTTTGPNNPANWYDGFTGFKKLTNNEPPLAMRYSSPIRCKLTPEVKCLHPHVLSCYTPLTFVWHERSVQSSIHPELGTCRCRASPWRNGYTETLCSGAGYLRMSASPSPPFARKQVNPQTHARQLTFLEGI